MKYFCPSLGFWTVADVLANGVRCGSSQWCTSSCHFRSNQRERSIGRSPTEQFLTTPIFHTPFFCPIQTPFLVCFTLLTTISMCTGMVFPSVHMCDHLPPTKMKELKSQQPLRTHKGWPPKVFSALSFPPLSRSCNFAPFLVGDGMWFYGKANHLHALARRATEQSHRVKRDDKTSMELPKEISSLLFY
jgi:hypothetical protein